MSYQPMMNMQQPSDEPLYNIGVVSRMTGIPVATLRVWERRYSFPESARTAGGHRLYSEREIMRLRWIKDRIDEGMQTGRAIHALHRLEEENRLPDALLAASTSPISATPRREPRSHPTPSDTTLAAFYERLTTALINHELDTAGQVLGDILSLYPMETLLLEVMQPALYEIGEAWHDGRINVATEHLATNFLRNRLLTWMTSGPPAYDVPPVVLACAPDEWHEMTLLIVGVLLRRLRWPVAYLGQALPLSDLAGFVVETRPDVVVLVAMTEQAAARLAEWPTYLPDAHASGQPVIAYAGAPFMGNETWQERVPGLYLGDSIDIGLYALDTLLHTLHRIGG